MGQNIYMIILIDVLFENNKILSNQFWSLERKLVESCRLVHILLIKKMLGRILQVWLFYMNILFRWLTMLALENTPIPFNHCLKWFPEILSRMIYWKFMIMRNQKQWICWVIIEVELQSLRTCGLLIKRKASWWLQRTS